MPRFSLSFLLLAVALTGAHSSFGNELDCSNPSYSSQAKQNQCAWLRYKAQDRELNKQYKATLAKLRAFERRELIAEQRDWLRNLANRCSEPLGPREKAGSMWLMEFNDCLAQETGARTKTLKRWPRRSN
jgi:uncharacterized protein YecT (DUF1311 family)